MKVKSSVKFYLEKRKDKETGEIITKNVPIFLFFSFDGKRMQYYTGYRIDQDKWNESDQKVRRNNFNKDGVSSTEINDHLDEIRSRVTEIYKESKALKMNPTVQYIREELKERLGEGGKKSLSIFNVFELFKETESQANTWTAGTVEKINNNIAHLKKFQESKKFRVEFDNMDEAFFNKYFAFLRDNLGHRNTTIARNFKIIKWFLNWATRKGYNKNLVFRDYKPELKGTKRSQRIVFLTWEELMHLYNLPIAKNYLNQVRDVFCFSCFTGLRYGDVKNLKHSNIKEDTIELTTIKTEDPLIIDLNVYSRAILEKYKDTPFEEDKCLPVISNQKMNEYLKELGQLAGFNQPETVIYYKGAERIEETYQKWQLIGTHTGRRTFISNAVFFNIPAEVIMSWTGHKDHKMMERYYKVIAPHRQREMKKFNGD